MTIFNNFLNRTLSIIHQAPHIEILWITQQKNPKEKLYQSSLSYLNPSDNPMKNSSIYESNLNFNQLKLYQRTAVQSIFLF